MTRNRARGVCRMRDLQRDIRYVYDLIEAMRENNVKGRSTPRCKTPRNLMHGRYTRKCIAVHREGRM